MSIRSSLHTRGKIVNKPDSPPLLKQCTQQDMPLAPPPMVGPTLVMEDVPQVPDVNMLLLAALSRLQKQLDTLSLLLKQSTFSTQ